MIFLGFFFSFTLSLPLTLLMCVQDDFWKAYGILLTLSSSCNTFISDGNSWNWIWWATGGIFFFLLCSHSVIFTTVYCCLVHWLVSLLFCRCSCLTSILTIHSLRFALFACRRYKMDMIFFFRTEIVLPGYLFVYARSVSRIKKTLALLFIW